MSTTMDKNEYLKKYLSSMKSLKKRKKIKKKDARVKIIDDDLDLNTFNEAVTEDLTGGEIEDAPQIVGVTDERPPELRINDYKTDMWKSVTVLDSDEEDDEVKARRQKDFSPLRIKVEPRDADNDNSSPRKSDDNSPPRQRKKRNYASDDNSPPRKRGVRNYEDNSPPRRDNTRKNDKSPPMQRNIDNSPARRDKSKRNESKSPPRTHNKKSKDSKQRVSRWNKDDRENDGSEDDRKLTRKRNNDSDSSPPRKEIHRKDTFSSPRKDKYGKKDMDNSLPRRDRNNRNKIDNSSKYNHRTKDDYEETDRKRNSNRDDRNIPSTSKSRIDKYDERHSKEVRNNPSTSKFRDNGTDGNSRNDRDYSTERSHILDKESSSFRRDKSVTSQGSQNVNLSVVKEETLESENNVPKTIVRDRKTGRIRNLQEEAAAKKEKQKEKEAIQEKYSRWGKGLKQVEDANEKRAQDLHEMQKPLARYADDTDLEDMLKNREREGDPMLEYLRKKNREKAKKDPNAKPEKPIYQGDCGPPNRFGIKPGHRWDGVNRSNGFENKYFEVQNSRRAHLTESYKWSSEDM